MWCEQHPPGAPLSPCGPCGPCGPGGPGGPAGHPFEGFFTGLVGGRVVVV